MFFAGPGFVFIEHDKLPEHMQRMVAGVGHRRSPSGGGSCTTPSYYSWIEIVDTIRCSNTRW